MDAPSELPSSQAMIGAWTVSRYFSVLRWPAAVLVLLLISATASGVNQNFIAGAEVLIFLGLGFWVTGRRAGKVETLTVGIGIGLMVGAAAAIGRFIHEPAVRWMVNILSEMLLTGIVAGLLAICGYLGRTIFLKSR